jgi:hypothetical protein
LQPSSPSHLKDQDALPLDLLVLAIIILALCMTNRSTTPRPIRFFGQDPEQKN